MATIPTATTNSDSPTRPIVRIVARNTAFMLGGQVIIKILTFIFSVYVVRRLGDAHFGRYATALAYVAVFATLTDLGTSALSVREMARKKEHIARMVPDIMALRSTLSLLVMIGITASAWAFGKTPDAILGISIASLVLLLYAFQGPLDSVMVSQERLDFSSLFKILNSVVFMSLGTILLIYGTGYIGLIIASLVGVLSMGLASSYVVFRVLKLRFERPDPRRWWSLLRGGFPFSIKSGANDLARRFDTVYMSFILSASAVGWYNVPFNMILTMILMAQSLSLSIYPSMVKQYASGRGSIQNTVQQAMRYLLIISLPIATGGMLVADKLITLLYGATFAPSIDVMRIIVWALPCMFLAELMGVTTNTLHLEGKAARVSIVRAFVSIVLNVLLIPRYGIIGASIAVVANWIIGITLSAAIVGPRLLFAGNVLPLLRVVSSAAAMGVTVYFIHDIDQLTQLPDLVSLLAVVLTGAVVYGLSLIIFQAVKPSEMRYILGIIRRKLHLPGRKMAVKSG